MSLDIAESSSHTQVTSPLTKLYEREKTAPKDIYLTQPVAGSYQDYSWQEIASQARKIANRLRAFSFPAGSRIAIFSKNCVEWFIVDLGIMMAGHVSVPIFASAGNETIDYVLKHADVKLMFIGKLDQPQHELSAIDESYHTVAFPYPNISASQQWAEFIDYEPIADSPEPEMDQIMTIIYTSGSTGKPKGVVHTYQSICWAAQQSLIPLQVNASDRLLSYLPLAHITERVLVELSSLYSGARIYFVESLDTFQRDVQACSPTLFISVPRLWTKFQMGILAKIPQQKLDFLLRIPLVNRLVTRKIRQGLGLGSARVCASGSAPLAPAVISWFNRIGIEICEGWGMTENSAYGTANLPFRKDKIGTIGKAYGGVDIQLGENGEILVKAPCNMKAYYLDEEKTAEVFTSEGYLKTGDKGAIDSEGYVRITGRLKDIFKTAKGKYVTPAPIEAKFMENPLIEQVCVTGTNLPQPVALMVLSEEARAKDKTVVEGQLIKTLERINQNLESHQKIDRVVVMKNEWSIENGLLTPTLKVKRHILEERFESVIQSEYENQLVWVNA